jgi:hypothetical protein
MSDQQVIRLPLVGAQVRIIANRENSVRFNPSAGGKAVLNLTGVVVMSNKDGESPVFVDVALWEDLALRFKDSIEHSQVAVINSQIEITAEIYNGEPKIKGRINCNNGYQFSLYPANVKGGATEHAQVEVPAQSIAPAAKTKKADNSIPF